MKTLRFGFLVGLLSTLAGGVLAQTPPPRPATVAHTTSAKAVKPADKAIRSTKSVKPAALLPPVGGIAPVDRARQMTASMTRALGLVPAQAVRVQEINLKSVQNVEEARRTYARQLPQMHAQIELIGRSRLSLLKNILTDQQFRDYETMREQKMGVSDADKQQSKMSEAAGGE